MARVTVTVNVRDLTRAELARMRHNFRSLGQDLTNAVGNRTRENFDRLSQSISTARSDLNRLRGAIPDAEFMRLDDAIRRSQRTMSRGFNNVGARAFQRVARQVQEVVDGFRDLDEHSQIRVRVDNSALERADALLDRWRRDSARRTIRQRVDVDTNPISRRLLRWATGPLRGLMGTIGGILSDGVGQGIVGAFTSPTFGALLVTAIAAAVAMAGAAISGLLVLALGGAFVALGGMIAAQSKVVGKAWEKELKALKPLFKEAAEPMIPVLLHGIEIMGKMGKEFAPKLEQALTQARPMLNDFIDSTMHGFRKLGQNAWTDLQSSFRIFLDAFGPQWEDFLAELGKSLGALARTVANHSEEIAIALRGVLGVINILIDTINFLANAWVTGVHVMIDTAAGFINAIGMVLDSFLGLIEGMLNGLATVAGVFGFEDEVKRAQEAFGQMRTDAVQKFTDMSNSIKQTGIDIDYNSRRRKLEVDIAAWTSELDRAKKELKDVPPEKRSDLKANIADLQNKIAQANNELASMQKDYYVRIHAYKVGDWALVGGGGPGQAFGGITGNHIGRAATGGARANMTLVGEHGPELVNLAPGSHVRSNGDSRRMFANSGGGGSRAVFEFKSSGRRADDLLLELLREAIHQRGGDPVTVLGGR